MPKLVFHDSDGVDKTFQLGSDPITIGRASDCEVQTHDAMVSRKHARIVWDGSSYFVEDLGSSNGVFLGQDKVQRAAFRPGDVVTCGSLVIRMMPEARRPSAQQEVRPQPQPVRAPPREEQRTAAADPHVDPAQIAAADDQRPDWNHGVATTHNPALAARTNDAESHKLRADLQREQDLRAQAESALLEAELRVQSADEAAREIIQLRRRVEQRDAEVRQLQSQPAPDLDRDAVSESVALFNDALAEVKSYLRAANDEAQLLEEPISSVDVVRDALKNALKELEHARAQLREMVRKVGLEEP